MPEKSPLLLTNFKLVMETNQFPKFLLFVKVASDQLNTKFLATANIVVLPNWIALFIYQNHSNWKFLTGRVYSQDFSGDCSDCLRSQILLLHLLAFPTDFYLHYGRRYNFLINMNRRTHAQKLQTPIDKYKHKMWIAGNDTTYRKILIYRNPLKCMVAAPIRLIGISAFLNVTCVKTRNRQYLTRCD